MTTGEPRTPRCRYCGGPIAEPGRSDRQYCKPSCRTLAYRARLRSKDGGAASDSMHVEPASAGQQDARLLLADIQARVASLAKHLRADTEREPSEDDRSSHAMSQAPASPSNSAAASLAHQPSAGTQTALQQLRQEAEVARQRADAAEQRAATMEAELQRAQDAARIAQRGMQELDEFYENLPKKLREEEARAAKAEEHLRLVLAQFGELRAQHLAAQEAARTAQSSQASLSRQLEEARRECQALRAKLAELMPPDIANDPLMPLMRDKVKLIDMLARAQERRTTGNWSLPIEVEHNPKEVQEAARTQALRARREFYFRQRYTSERPRWIHEDRQLDADSEKTLHTEQLRELELLRRQLASER